VSVVASRIRPLISRLCAPLEFCSRERRLIRKYLSGGRQPWSKGYVQFKERFIAQALADESLMHIFTQNDQLPNNYGHALDERVVEFPWVISQLSTCGRRILDAGSALNHSYLLDLPAVRSRDVTILTLAPERFFLPRSNVSYMFGDLRGTVIRDASMSVVTCISTLEHIGMDNTMIYTADKTFDEAHPDDYKKVLAEIRRVLIPGGFALITVPFGKKENHGWLQQFDLNGIQEIIRAFDRCDEVRFYRYQASGWQRSSAEQCAGCEYYNVHARAAPDPDLAAAARAVACIRVCQETR